ncbi:Transcriptional regulatory protein PHO23 [Fusarium oxysporum f. sp. cubense race 1]|uniref:Chromatin modification-related protein n=1 Tax=Fusarium oxysporum f. sp. cubense (strain race 1) TaxID=1229664 RepID=N4TUG5_FUSC1|nr:Transcriptional regulatory protein PHO23 [Fusarium oxysporum f. sp. cubense race 1]
MKSAKAPATENSSHRRSQPVRQTRTNPPRSIANLGRSGGAGRDSIGGAEQPIDIFPAITHFADAITALPKELVRHFTLLKEVDAKLFTPEDQRPNNEASSANAPGSAPMSAQNSSSGIAFNNSVQSVPSVDESNRDAVFDPSNLPRRHLFRQTALKIQEMLVSLEEKNHVISTANEALQAQLTRIEDVWPHLEGEFSDEAKWGSTTHWAYPENRFSKASHVDRTRRDGAAAISAAAQALADEAAARSDARKQAVQAKKNSRNHNNNHNHSNAHNHDSEGDDHDGKHKPEAPKKTAKSRKTVTATETANVGLGISTAATNNGNPPQKRRKVEKTTNGAAATTERAMSSVFGNAAPKAKTTSPRATPAPEAPKKRKALPSGSGQSKKSRNGVTGLSNSVNSSPVITELPEPKLPPVRASPVPVPTPNPARTRSRQNSIQTVNTDSNKARPTSSASNKPNGIAASTPAAGAPAASALRNGAEPKTPKETSAPIKTENPKKEAEKTETASAPPVPTPTTTATISTTTTAATTTAVTTGSKKDTKKPEENDRKSESLPPVPQTSTVTTKSGRASKPSTPALATFQEAVQPRARSSRNNDGTGTGKKNQKKAAPTIHAAVAAQLAEEDTNSSMQGDEDDGDVDADEPTYCYCNGVSYGEMVACDAVECPREWFHLECVGLKVAPTSTAKWYCEDCKERLKAGGKKANGR